MSPSASAGRTARRTLRPCPEEGRALAGKMQDRSIIKIDTRWILLRRIVASLVLALGFAPTASATSSRPTSPTSGGSRPRAAGASTSSSRATLFSGRCSSTARTTRARWFVADAMVPQEATVGHLPLREPSLPGDRSVLRGGHVQSGQRRPPRMWGRPTITFSSSTAAHAGLRVGGDVVTKQIQRQTFRANNPTGSFQGRLLGQCVGVCERVEQRPRRAGRQHDCLDHGLRRHVPRGVASSGFALHLLRHLCAAGPARNGHQWHLELRPEQPDLQQRNVHAHRPRRPGQWHDGDIRRGRQSVHVHRRPFRGDPFGRQLARLEEGARVIKHKHLLFAAMLAAFACHAVAQEAFDACEVFTQADAEAALGTTAQPEPVNPKVKRPKVVSKCTYTGSRKASPWRRPRSSGSAAARAT